jgi:hypothetical protein
MSLTRKHELRDQCTAPATAPTRSSQRELLSALQKTLALPAPFQASAATAQPPPPAPPSADGHAIKCLSPAEMDERRRQLEL